MNTIPNSKKDDVLYAFSVDFQSDGNLLDEYINQYPQYRDELIDISIELSLAPEEIEMPVEGEMSESVERSWAKFQSAIAPSDPICLSTSVVENPLEALDKKSFRSLSKALNVSLPFLARLRDRTIKTSTLPIKLIEKIAQNVGVEFELMRDALSGSTTVSSAVKFKADGKPVAGKQMTFDDAIDSSNLSEEQKSELRKMKE